MKKVLVLVFFLLLFGLLLSGFADVVGTVESSVGLSTSTPVPWHPPTSTPDPRVACVINPYLPQCAVEVKCVSLPECWYH